MNTKILIQGLALTTLLVSPHLAGAAIFNLCTGVTTKTMPDATSITMWGYGLDPTGSGNCTATVPGPQLDVPDGESVLTIKLRNTLPQPTSIMITGLSSTSAPAPQYFADSNSRQRARAMTHEAPTNGTITTYNFTAAPGTYLYQSGSHPAVQVQMGLYGGVTNDTLAGEAYSGVAYDKEVVLLYSEIDPALHTAVAGLTYGTAAYPTTINYVPKYFLVNGAPFEEGITPDIPASVAGESILIRFLNAGLETHVPVLHGGYMDLIAEYGSPYPYPRKQYSFELAAGQSRDAIFTPDTADRYVIFDRRLRLTNNMDLPGGGLMSFLDVKIGAASLVSPTGNLADFSPQTFEWNAVVGASQYKLLVQDSSGAALINTWYTDAEAGCDLGTCSVTYTAITLATNNKYKWRIRPKHKSTWGPWSAITHFSIGSAPVAAVLGSPNSSANVTIPNPTFEWTAAAGAIEYKLLLISSGTQLHNQWYTELQAGCDIGTACSITPALLTPLVSGDYKWRIRTRNIIGWGPWSAEMPFTAVIP